MKTFLKNMLLYVLTIAGVTITMCSFLFIEWLDWIGMFIMWPVGFVGLVVANISFRTLLNLDITK